MKILVEVEGKTDVTKILDIFKALETSKINITKSQKLQQIEEIKELKQEIKQEVENMLGEKIHVDELIVTKNGTYLLKGKIEK